MDGHSNQDLFDSTPYNKNVLKIRNITHVIATELRIKKVDDWGKKKGNISVWERNINTQH